MGDDRNSYSKTDSDATFMRMKDDHMMNGQLKPGYNVQFGIENQYTIDILLTKDRTDYHTLIPIVEKHKEFTKVALKEFIADSGYSSEEGLSYLHEQNITPYIKLQTHEKQKTRKYKNDIGKHYNMQKLDAKTYVCANNKRLEFQYKFKRAKDGFERNYAIYECTSCEGCHLKDKCFYNYNEQKHKRQKQKNYNQS